MSHVIGVFICCGDQLADFDRQSCVLIALGAEWNWLQIWGFVCGPLPVNSGKLQDWFKISIFFEASVVTGIKPAELHCAGQVTVLSEWGSKFSIFECEHDLLIS